MLNYINTKNIQILNLLFRKIKNSNQKLVQFTSKLLSVRIYSFDPSSELAASSQSFSIITKIFFGKKKRPRAVRGYWTLIPLFTTFCKFSRSGNKKRELFPPGFCSPQKNVVKDILQNVNEAFASMDFKPQVEIAFWAFSQKAYFKLSALHCQNIN